MVFTPNIYWNDWRNNWVFSIRKDDPRKAKNCIYIGIVMMIIGIIFNIMLLGVDVVSNPGFNVNV